MREMPNCLVRTLALVFTLVVFITTSTASAAPEELQVKIDTLFSPHNMQGSPGAAVVIIQNGEVLVKRGYGFSDIEQGVRVESDTAFHLASVGKQMTALGVLLLVQERKLSVEDPVSKYLSQLKGWGSRVKIKHLLYHTSGLPDYYEDIVDEYRQPSNSQALRFLQGLRYLEFTPGVKFEYSNSGYDTLGALIQKVGKQSFGSFMDSRIFTPLGMTNSFAFSDARRGSSKRAFGYSSDRNGFYLDDDDDLNGLHGSGSIYSSLDDLVKYDSGLFGGALLSRPLLLKMFTSGKTNAGKLLKYGYGWDVVKNSDYGGTYYGHSGGWMGFSSYYLHYPNRNLSVIVLSNSSETDAESLAFNAAALL